MSAPANTDHRPPGWPRVVALGGGYGLSTSLRAIKHYATTLTGVVSVAVAVFGFWLSPKVAVLLI